MGKMGNMVGTEETEEACRHQGSAHTQEGSVQALVFIWNIKRSEAVAVWVAAWNCQTLEVTKDQAWMHWKSFWKSCHIPDDSKNLAFSGRCPCHFGMWTHRNVHGRVEQPERYISFSGLESPRWHLGLKCSSGAGDPKWTHPLCLRCHTSWSLPTLKCGKILCTKMLISIYTKVPKWKASQFGCVRRRT